MQAFDLKLKRFDPGRYTDVMQTRPEGGWVRYSDVLNILSDLRRELLGDEAVEAAQDHIAVSAERMRDALQAALDSLADHKGVS